MVTLVSHRRQRERRKKKQTNKPGVEAKLPYTTLHQKPRTALAAIPPCSGITLLAGASAWKAERNRLSSAFYASAVQKETKQKNLLPVKGSCCFTSPPPLPPAGAGERLRGEQREEENGGRGLCENARASGMEVSRAEQCLGPCSICGRRSLWRRSRGDRGGSRSPPSSSAVSLAQQVAASLIPGEDPAARAIISVAASCSSKESLITLFQEAGEERLSLSCSGKNRGMSLQHPRAPAHETLWCF